MPSGKWILATALVSAAVTVLILRSQYASGKVGDTVSKLTGRM